jgi:hypothetical protein
MDDYGDQDNGRRKVLLGGAEYENPNIDASRQPIRYHARFRPGDFSGKRKRGGFFARRGSLILFVDLVIVAVVALTLYPVYGRKDRARWEGYTFTLQAETLEKDVYFDLLVEAPAEADKVQPGKVYTVSYSVGDHVTGPLLLLLPAREGSGEHHRKYLRDVTIDEESAASALITIDDTVLELKIGL